METSKPWCQTFQTGNFCSLALLPFGLAPTFSFTLRIFPPFGSHFVRFTLVLLTSSSFCSLNRSVIVFIVIQSPSLCVYTLQHTPFSMIWMAMFVEDKMCCCFLKIQLLVCIRMHIWYHSTVCFIRFFSSFIPFLYGKQWAFGYWGTIESSG